MLVLLKQRKKISKIGVATCLFFTETSRRRGSKIIKNNHIFSCKYSTNRVGNQLIVEIRQSNLPKHSAKQLPTFKSGFWERKNFPNSAKGLQGAITARKDLMRAALDD